MQNSVKYEETFIIGHRRGIAIKLKRLKPRAPNFGAHQNFGSKDNFQHFCKQLYLYFCFGSKHVFFTMPLTKDRYRTGQHNSESSKGQIININLVRAPNVYFIWMWKFRCSIEEILKRQLLIRDQAFVTFSTIEKTLADLKKPFRGPFVVQGCFRMSAKD